MVPATYQFNAIEILAPDKSTYARDTLVIVPVEQVLFATVLGDPGSKRFHFVLRDGWVVVTPRSFDDARVYYDHPLRTRA